MTSLGSVLRAFVCWSVITLNVAAEVSFRKDVAPVLLEKCYGCHNADTSEGGYSVASFESLLDPGDSGLATVIPSNIAASELLRRLTTDDEDERMPAEGDPLPNELIQQIKRWIEGGAHYDADDPKARLASILPIRRHPKSPAVYRFPLPITALAFADDHLLVGGYHELLRWDLAEETLIQRIPQVGERVYSIESDAHRLYVGSGTPGTLGEVRVLDKTSGDLLGVLLSTRDVVFDVALNPTFSTLAVASADGEIHLLDLRRRTPARIIDSHSDWVRSITWSDDGTRFATASRDKTAKVFDASATQPLATFADHKEDVVDVQFVPGDAARLVSCDAAGSLKLWQANGDKTLKDFTTDAKHGFRLMATPDALWFASSRADLTAFAWDGEQVVQKLGVHDQWIAAMAVDAERSRLATGDLRGRVRVWRIADGKLLNEFVAMPTQ